MTTGGFTGPPKVEGEKKDRADQRDPDGQTPRPACGQQRGQHAYHRRPRFQSSSRAQTVTPIPASAKAMKAQRNVSR